MVLDIVEESITGDYLELSPRKQADNKLPLVFSNLSTGKHTLA